MKFKTFSSHVTTVTSVFLMFCSDFICNAQSTSSYRICVPEKSLTACNEMVNEFNSTVGKIVCVSANDKIGCITKVVKNEADFLPLEPEEIYVAHRFEASAFSVITEIRSAEFANRDFRYEPVAIIKNSAGISSISDLKGKRSCHTGFGRNAGWKIPFSHLMDKNELPPFCEAEELPTLEKDLYAVSNYFSAACAPGSYVPEKDEDRKLKDRYANLCALCKSPNECSKDDKYSGYEGALKCLTEGSGDVAWTKMDAVENVFKLKEGATPISSDYSFLCWDGSSMPLTSPRPCSWAKRPWRAILASKRLNATLIKDLQDQITAHRTEGVEIAKNTNIIPSWMLQVLEINITDIEKHNPPSVAKTITSLDYLDSKNYTVTIEKPSCATKKFIKFCVLSEVEKLKCMDLRLAAMGRRILPGIHCVLGESNTDCMEKIKNGEADVMSLSPKEAERALNDYGLTPLLAELETLDSEGDVGAYRYAVAVVQKEAQFHNNISSLRGKKSCHGSVRSLAGWNIPLTVLRDAGEIEGKTCGLTIELAQYFNATCVPGARDPALKMSWLPESLCGLCAGDGEGEKNKSSAGFCQDNDSERYYGDLGALRCLTDKVADVAFIDHVSLQKENPDIKRDDLQLLCKNGAKMALTQARHCNWGLIPSNKVIARNEDKDIIDRKDARFILLKAVDNFKPGVKTETILKLFGPYYDNSDLLFKDTSVGLVDDSASKSANTQIMKDFDYCTTSGSGWWNTRSLNVIFVTLVLYTYNNYCSY